MTRITGTIFDITGPDAEISEVWIWAAKPHPHGDGWMITTKTHVPAVDGQIDVELIPGPAVIAAVTEGMPIEHARLVVPDTETAELSTCITTADVDDNAGLSAVVKRPGFSSASFTALC